MSGTGGEGAGGGFGPVASTRNADLQALGTGGQLAVQAWEQIAGHLRRRFGAEHARLLAEPNPDPDRGLTDWYAEGGSGEAPTLDSLPPERQEAARAELARLVTDIRAEAEALRASARESERFLGELLALALVTPGPDSVRVVGSQPVLVAWAHARAGETPAPELLIGMLGGGRRATAGAAAAPMRILRSTPPAPPRHGLGWLLGGLALLLPLLLLLLLWRDPFHWFAATPQCALEPGDLALLRDLRAEEGREARLRAEMARLAQGLGERRLACPPLPRPEQPARHAEPAAPPSADAERAREQGGRSGRIQFILAWDDQNDIDLAVLCPGGGRIFFGQPNACGGVLDVDRNAGGQLTARPVENVVFEREPSPGRYRIRVTHYAHNPPAPPSSDYRVTLRREGQPDQVFTGRIAPNQEIEVGHFESPLR